MKQLGICLAGASTTRFSFVGKERVELGEYVELEYENHRVLGFVKNVERRGEEFGEGLLSSENADDIIRFLKEKTYFYADVLILGDPDRSMKIPRVPPQPGTPVYRARDEVLKKVFGKEGRSKIKIGTLLTRGNIDVYVDVNKIVNKHLAILAITGSGKSNTVSVIIEGILSKGGCVLVFDMHGEYVNLKLEDGAVNIIPLELNPYKLSYQEFKTLANIDDSAYVQDRYLRKAFYSTVEAIFKGEYQPSEFWNIILGHLSSFLEEDKRAVTAVINKVEDLRDYSEGLFNPLAIPMIEKLKENALNVIDLSHKDERVADTVVSHILRNLLEKRKEFYRTSGSSGIPYPVLTVLEEAHILASYTINTRSRYWISRVAREGRKFGIGLCLVSQRPKSLDSNALSQVNNLIIMKLIEPGDQKHIQQSSETLSMDLVEQLPSLNVGEALVMGEMISVPALVKISRSKAKVFGGDVDVVGEWENLKKKSEKIEEELDSFLSGL